MLGLQDIIWIEFALFFPTLTVISIYFLRKDRHSNQQNAESIITDNRTNTTINNIENLEKDTGGYITISIPEEIKSIFHDLLKGFEEYAALKGYKVSVSIDDSEDGKISFKIIVHDFGVTANRKIIKKDLDEYLEKIKRGDFDNIPEILDPIEHARLVMALKNRIVFLQQNYEVERNIREFYEKFFERLPLQSISHASQPVLHITNTGSSEMDERKYIANNSANVMQGDNHNNIFKTGDIQIGSTYTEKKDQIEKVDELIAELKKSDLKGQQDAIRHIENVKEELADSENPDKSQIGKWLGKAGSILAVAERGSALFLKAKSVFDSFGISL